VLTIRQTIFTAKSSKAFDKDGDITRQIGGSGRCLLRSGRGLLRLTFGGFLRDEGVCHVVWWREVTYGFVLLVTAMNVFLYVEILVASSAMYLVESLRSLATQVVSLPSIVDSVLTFCKC
jgi:hypothetical protein